MPEMSPTFIILQFFLTEQYQFYRTLPYMTGIKAPINTTSDATFLSVLCENPKKVLLAKSWGAVAPPAPPGITPLTQENTVWFNMLAMWYIIASLCLVLRPLRALRYSSGVVSSRQDSVKRYSREALPCSC